MADGGLLVVLRRRELFDGVFVRTELEGCSDAVHNAHSAAELL